MSITIRHSALFTGDILHPDEMYSETVVDEVIVADIIPDGTYSLTTMDEVEILNNSSNMFLIF